MLGIKRIVVFLSLGLLIIACEKQFEPQIMPPAPSTTFDGEAFKFTKVDFSTLPEQFQLTRMRAPFDYPKGTVIVDPNARFVYLMENDEGIALRYPIAVGREGFEWSGSATIERRAKWPTWRPTPSMLEDNPSLEKVVDGGPKNPLGARALYLYDANGNDTLYRIHGTNAPRTIGTASSSGCIRMFNEHVIDLYNRVPNGAPVVVLPLGAAAQAQANKKPESFNEYVSYIREGLLDAVSSSGE